MQRFGLFIKPFLLTNAWETAVSEAPVSMIASKGSSNMVTVPFTTELILRFP